MQKVGGNAQLVSCKFSTTLDEIAHCGGAEASEEAPRAFGGDDLASAGEKVVAFESGVDLNAGFDNVDG